MTPTLEGFIFTFLISIFDLSLKTVNIMKNALELMSEGMLYLLSEYLLSQIFYFFLFLLVILNFEIITQYDFLIFLL